MKKGKPYIPPGAPGHPRTGSEGGPRGPRRQEPPRVRKLQEEDAERDAGPRRPAEGRGRPESGRPSGGRPARARLVYEDDDILAFDKPVGLPVIAADGSRSRSLLDIATEHVRRRNPKGRAAVVHRIDRGTSGAVVFARSARVKRELMGDWDGIVAERRYVALVRGSMGAKTGCCDTWLKENKAGTVYRAAVGERGAKRAITRWRLLGEGAGLSLLELFLETGRKHQIRVQLADIGHPVAGDERYGGAPPPALDRLCLHAASIELAMPGREPLLIECPAPPEFEAALGRDASRAPSVTPRGPGSKEAGSSGRPASSSASRSAARSGAPPRPAAPRGRKPPSRS